MTILPQLKHDVVSAASRYNAAPVQTEDVKPFVSKRRRPVAAWMTAAASLLLVAAVVGVIIATTHHSNRNGPTRRAPVVETRAALVHMLGILRRPQTAAEHAIKVPLILGGQRPGGEPRPPFLGRWGYPQIQRQLVRTVAVPHGQFLIFPLTHRASGAHHRSEAIALGIGLNSQLGEFLSPTSVKTLQQRGANLFDYGHDRNIGAIVVPDGVSSVKLGDFRVAGGPKQVKNAGIHPTTTGVHHNVAVFDLPAPTIAFEDRTSYGMASAGATVSMTWYAPSGQVVKRATIRIAFNYIAKQPSARYPTNQHGQTYGSSSGAASPAEEPQLIAATGKTKSGKIVSGYVRRWQLNAGSCGHVKTPAAAARCSSHEHPHRIPLLARNGTTVIGRFTVGGG